MEQDQDKKRDQKGKKPSIKIQKINIPDNVRAILNRGQGAQAGAQLPGQGAADASSLSTLDPFIKIIADSNKGIILMPVLSDVKFSIPPGSIGSFVDTSSQSSTSSRGKSDQQNISEKTGYSQGKKDDKGSRAPFPSSSTQSSLSFPNFSSLSKAPSPANAAMNFAGNMTPSISMPGSSNGSKDFNISFPSDGKNSGFNISIQPKQPLSSSSGISEEERQRASSLSSRNGMSISPLQESSDSYKSSINIGQDALSRAPSSEVKTAAADILENIRQSKAAAAAAAQGPPYSSPSSSSSSSSSSFSSFISSFTIMVNGLSHNKK